MTIKQTLPHLISFLEKNLVTELNKAHLKSRLGHIYWATYLDGKKAVKVLEEALKIYEKYYNTPHPRKAYALGELGIAHKILGNREKEKKYLEESLVTYQNCYKDENQIKIAWLLANLGSFYRKSDYEKSQTYFKKALDIYIAHYGRQDIRTSWVLGNLGRFYRNFGNYKKAKDTLEETITIQQNNGIKNQIEYAWLIINLGIVHHNLDEDLKAKELIEKGLSIYKKHLGHEHIELAWAQIHLGTVLGALGNLREAKHLIEKSLEQYIKHYSNDHEETSWAMKKLGVSYLYLKDFKKANHYFEKSLVLCKKYYSIDSAQTASVLYNIGKAKLLEGDLTIGEEYLNKALHILENKNHPKAYRVLESLIELYKKQQSENQQLQIYTKIKVINDKLLECLKPQFWIR